MSLKTIAKSALLAILALALPGLAGCSMDDIQLNGKVFDAMGMNTTGSVKSGDPKMAVREPLVVPPGLDLVTASRKRQRSAADAGRNSGPGP